jgi:hypothetical protein
MEPTARGLPLVQQTARACLNTNQVRMMEQLHASFSTLMMRARFVAYVFVFQTHARTLCKWAPLAHHAFSHGRQL